MKKIFSPNFNFRSKETKIDMVILHYTGMQSKSSAIKRLCDKRAKVSSHYLIDQKGETNVKIKILDNIKKIYSHPQALAQCRIYLSEKLPQADLIPSSSTSAAFSDLLNDPENSAAIAHARNAKKHNLNICLLYTSDAADE